MASSPSSQQASLSSSSTSHHGHLARQLALKTVKAMIRSDWTNCNDNIKQISGVCSSWLKGKDPSMTLASFQSLWCHTNTLASVTSPSGDVEDRLELQLHLSATCPVLSCCCICQLHALCCYAFALLSTGFPCELIHNFVFISIFRFDFGGFFLFITVNRIWWLANLDWTFQECNLLCWGCLV